MKKILISLLFILLIAGQVQAENLFTLSLQQPATGINDSRGFSSALDLLNTYSDGSLSNVFINYDDTKASDGYVNFRGVDMSMHFTDTIANVVTLTISVPGINVSETFSGASQEDAFRQFKDYLQSNKDDLLKKILAYSVSKTPYDAVAGNPNSLMNNMNNQSFSRAGGNVFGSFVSFLGPAATRHTFDYQGQKTNADVYCLPLGYTFNFANDRALMLDLPLMYTNMENTKTYAAQLGLGLKIPLTEYWRLIPGARAGAVFSEDLFSGGVLYECSLSSNFQIPVDKWIFGMTNMAAYAGNISVKVGGYELGYDLQNWIWKNGVQASYSLTKLWDVGVKYIYTKYTGSELFIDGYHTIGASVLYRVNNLWLVSGVALNCNFMFADNYKASRIGVDILFKQ